MEAEVVVTITENSGKETYDGSEKVVTGYTVSISNPLYTEADFSFNGDAAVKGTNAGTYGMELKASDFTNKNANFANVRFVIVDGTLTIDKMALTITADSDTKVYDGTALTDSGYTNTALAAGDAIESVTVSGARIVVGTSNNVPSAAVIKNADGKDVTASYEITYVNGTLTVVAGSGSGSGSTTGSGSDTATGSGFFVGSSAFCRLSRNRSRLGSAFFFSFLGFSSVFRAGGSSTGRSNSEIPTRFRSTRSICFWAT